ncbi:hypothetical protein J6590_053949 [Homalodisca vitripennis]|nr:hypothetical protein J6590_053949 [Homalodisca vitripennis]
MSCEYLAWLCLVHRSCRLYVKVLMKVQANDNDLFKLKDFQSTKLLVTVVYVMMASKMIGAFYLDSEVIDKHWYHYLLSVLNSYMIICHYMITLPYIVTAHAIADRFRCIDENLRETLFIKQLTIYASLVEFERIRQLHIKLCSAAENLVGCFSLITTAFFGLSYFDTVIRMGIIVRERNLNYAVDAFFMLSFIILSYSIISASEDLYQASYSILHTLRDLPLSNKPDSFYIQVKQFTLQVKSMAVRATAGNFFLLRKKSIPAIAGSMVSFFVVIVQLAPAYLNNYLPANITKYAEKK